MILSKIGHPCPSQNCSKGPPADTGRGSLMNHHSCPPDDTPVKGLNRTALFLKLRDNYEAEVERKG